MSPEERTALVAAWIEHNSVTYAWDRESILRRFEGAQHSSALSQLNEICRKEPELCWELILEILRTPHPESVAGMVAAGPLEDLLAIHGARFIDRVEEQAASDPYFKEV